MKNMTRHIFALTMALGFGTNVSAQDFKLNERGYFQASGINVMAFDDIYPEGHQGGVALIMNGQRVATNGDLRLEATPGQWQPVPKQLTRKASGNTIETTLCYPDSSRHMTGFNPMIYPDLQMKYTVKVEAVGSGVMVTVDLDKPIPEKFLGKVGFNFEFFPGILFGKPWLMDNQTGLYPQQPNSPVIEAKSNLQYTGDFYTKGSKADFDHLTKGKYNPIVADNLIALPYAEGKKFTSRPDEELNRVTIESLGESTLKLYDGRMNHNNGWFVLRSEVPAGATKGAIKWMITPEIKKDWMYKPVVQTSQIGYHVNQQKSAVIELDERDAALAEAQLIKLTSEGEKVVQSLPTTKWGKFLRYNYLKVDFTSVKEEGMYLIRYGKSVSPTFRIASNVYDRGVWQPVLEYFLPVQMCHMRINEKYKVWHDFCHLDDARMAPAHNHVDGYDQKPGLSKFNAGDLVHGVNVGGWHDAGDFDLRIESQSGECYILALAYEAFHPEIDATEINQQTHVVEIHQPDGKNDLLQQVEHGALSVVNGYLALGRLYRGIICPDLRQYVLLGDASAMTDNVKGNDDDRWIFTEDNPGRELSTAANLAASSRVLKNFNDTLSVHCLNIAKEIFTRTKCGSGELMDKLHAAAELYITTQSQEYLDFILAQQETMVNGISGCGWYLTRVEQLLKDKKDKKIKNWIAAYKKALAAYSQQVAETSKETPYGVPYRPHIWGAGWDIQNFGFQHYFLTKTYPELFDSAPMFSALNFVLGCHPGSNQASFASGVGATSATVGYGLNRSDWSYIPGGVISGTALIRPDFPELLTFPFLWQQTEYVLGGGSSHYMFLVLAAQQMTK